MSEEILARAEEYLARRRNRMRLLRAITAMALVVAIMTSYVLMLPGLTLQADAYCGYEEHAHTADCYTLDLTCTEEEREPSETVVKLLQCSFKPHQHTELCMTAEGVPGCGVATAYWHRHTSECYDEAGSLVCTLADNPRHEHTAACYEQLAELTCTAEENPGHVHDNSCYGIVVGAEPTCGLEEGAGHVHSEACEQIARVLVCDMPTTTTTDLPDHVHVDACYAEQTQIVCGLAEGEGAHTHADDCYPVSEEPTCGLLAGEGGHAHGDSCYVYTQGELKCDKLHMHNSSCYDPETGFVICGKLFLIEHNHSAYCLRNVTAIEEGHAHSDACYVKNYTCDVPEHAHTPDCFVAPEPELPVEPTAEPVPTTEISTVEPTVEPTVEATVEPTVEPTVEATVEPTVEPTVEATVEPTVEPTVEATVEPTVEPTVEATVEPTVEPTVEATVEPTVEPTVEATVEPTVEATIEPTVEPTETPETTPAPEEGEDDWDPDVYHEIEDLLAKKFYCGLSAHTHADECRDETGALICGYEMEHVHDATCTASGNDEYHCGKRAHSHDEYCFDQDGALICDEKAHTHTIDCLYACGKIQHSHSDDCLNEAGEPTCGLDEHEHDAVCAIVSSDKDTSSEIMSGAQNFNQYIADSKWNTQDGVSIKDNGTVVYDPTTDSYTTTLDISFAIPNYVLRGYTYWNGWFWVNVPGEQDFYYEIPDGIKISDDMLEKPFPITSPDGSTIEGTFYIKKSEDTGKYYLDIHFSDSYVRTASAGYSMPGWPVNQTPYSQGSISFGCTIGSEHVQEDSSIRIEFTTEDVLEIPAKDIEYPEDDKGIYNIATEKSGSYIREGNKLYYKVLVHSDKGTPSHVKLDDKLLFNGIKVESFGTPTVNSYTSTWNGSSWVKDDGSDQSLSVVSGGPAELTDTTATYKAHQGPAGDIKYDIHLPQIDDPGDGKRYTYEVTYEINLEDVGLEFNGNGTNTVTAKSETKPDNKVQSTASSNVGIYIDSLTKVGSYNQQTDKIKWSITVNAGGQDIAGAVLTDEMFTKIAEADEGTIIVKDANGNVLSEGNGYQINTADGKVSSIEFFGTSTEDGVEVNRNKYVIEYYTTPSQNDSEYTEYNNAKLDKDDEEVTEQGGAYVKRDLRLTKQNTGASMSEDGTHRLIDWKSTLTVFDNGLNTDLVVKDTLSGDNHYMSAQQVADFYNSLMKESWFNTGTDNSMMLTYTDAEGNKQTIDAKTVAANPSQYADLQFTEFTFTILKNNLPTEYWGETIEINYQSTADVAGLNGTAYYYNNFGVGTSSAGASHGYTQTEIVKVDKLNYWDGQDEMYISTSGQVEWHINVTQDKEYEKLIVTDTLPTELALDYLAFGPYGDGRITLTQTDFDPESETAIPLTYTTSYHEQALQVTGTYVPKTGVITLEFTRKSGVDSSLAHLDGGFGAGETLKLKVFASVKDDYKPTGDENDTSRDLGKLTNQVHVSTNEGVYGDDEHSYNVTVNATAKVTKTDGTGNKNDTTVTTDTGELSWMVKVHQDNNYKTLTITDTLPSAVDLTSIKIGQFMETSATYDASKAVNGVVDLEFTNGFNDQALSYEGTYNLNTGVVTITVTENEGQDSPVFGKDKTLEVKYFAQMKDEYIPDTEKGEYVKDPVKLTNNVTVTTENGDYGSDSQTQEVTVKKEEPKKETVGKNHTWTPSMNLLHYTVDLNPGAADLDPSKNMLTVTDKITYINDPTNYDRELTLIKNSVRLYYADYDADGVPLRDENGRLIKGVEVPYSDWTMTYSSNLYESNWQQSDCTMTLTVPDERALILEYDYRVTMNYVPGWDNEIRLTNTVTITGYDGYSDSTDSTDKWEKYNAGGVVSTEKSFSIVKMDASNHAKLIEGAVFTVYRYDMTTGEGQWVEHAEYVTDANGNFMVQWQQNDADEIRYEENVAYKIVETQPALGYILDPNPVPYYFYWANANVTTSSLPENWVTEYSPRELVTNPGHVEIENIRRTTETEVTKIWQDANGNPLSDDLKKPVTVHLKRYAIPKDVWEAHKEYNHGLSSKIISVAGAVRALNNTTYPSFDLMVYAGSTVSFDVVVETSWLSWGFEPVFSNLPAGSTTSRSVIGNYTYIHFDVPVEDSIVLDGWFKNSGDGRVWDGEFWGNGVSIQNVSVITGTSDIEDGGFSAELQQYRDRNYTNTMTLTAAGGWHGEWSNLDLIGLDANNQEVHYKYYVVEDAVNGFATTITGGSSDISGSFVVTNTYDQSKTELTSLKVVKTWLDENGDPIPPMLDAVEVRLYQKDELTGKEIVYPYNGFATTVLNEATQWSFNFRNLPHGTWDANGNVTQFYTYRIEEVTKGNFVTQIVAVNAVGDEVEGDNMNGATVNVINSKKHPVSAEVIKVWSDGNDTHSGCSVTVRLDRYILTQDGYELDPTFNDANRTQVLSADTNWKFKWENLPDSDDNGNGYQYRVVETLVDGEHVSDVGYIPLYSTTNGYIPNDGSTTITNKRPASLEISKKWLDKNGNETTAPDGASVTFELWRTTRTIIDPHVMLVEKAYDPIKDPGTAVDELVATFTFSGSTWNKTFTGLPAESLSNQAYHYYVKEIALEGYEVTYDGNYCGPDGAIVVENKRIDTSITYINVNKQWTDLNGNAVTPTKYTEVYYKLYEGNNDITSGLTKEANGVTLDETKTYIVVTAETAWKLTVNGLTEGNTYRVEEYLKVGEDIVKADGAAYSPASGGTGTTFNVTNRLTSITVEKVWKDAEGNVITVDNSKQVELTLMRQPNNGNAVALQTVTLPIENTAADGTKTYSWSTTISDLLAGDSSSVLYTYYFEERTVPAGFAVSYSTTDANGQTVAQNSGTITVTNTQQSVSFSLEKVWQDKAGNVMTAPTGVSIAFYLMRVGTGEPDMAGNPTDEIVEIVYLPQGTQEQPSWRASFNNLPKADLNGNEYKYYISEGSSNGMADYVVTYSPAAASGQKTDILDDGEKVTVTNKLQPKMLKINVMKRWTSGSTVKDVKINVYRYIKLSDGQIVYDPNSVKQLTFTAGDTAAYQTVSNLPDFVTNASINGGTYTGEVFYYVEEQEVSKDYTVTYSKDNGENVVVNGKDAALNTDGNLRVTNHERSKLNVRKVWNGVDSPSEITFNLYRKQVEADTSGEGDDEEEEVEFIDVKFQIIVPYTYTAEDGSTVSSVAVLTTENRTFQKGAHVVWQPIWTCDVNWYPNSSAAQNITFTAADGTATPVNFSNPTPNGSAYTYSFDLGYLMSSGTVTWTTDNWYQNGNGRSWGHSFVVDGISEVIEKSLRVVPRSVDDQLVGTFKLDGNGANEQNGVFTITFADGTNKTYTYTYQDGGWNMLFYDLPILSDDGAYKYLYYVEEQTTGYLVTYANNDGVQNGEIVITNSPKEVKKASVTVTKNYSNGNTDKPNVDVELYRSVTENNVTLEERVATVKLTPGVAHTWNDLLIEGEITQNGQTVKGKYTYYVKEIVPTGYTVSYSTENGVVTLTDVSDVLATGEVTITNTPKTGLTVEKKWNTTAADKIDFVLKRSAYAKEGTETNAATVDVTFQIVYDYTTTDPNTGVTQSGRKVLSSTTQKFIKGAYVDWTPTWKNTNDDQHPTTGTITYNGAAINFADPVENVDEYKYTFHLGQVNAGGTVIWVVNGDFADDPAKGYTWTQAFNRNAGKTISTHTLDESNGWKQVFYDLPYEENGYTYKYFVEELTEGYDVTYTENTQVNQTTGEVEGSITITNSEKKPDTTFIKVEKRYLTTDSNPQEVTVKLYKRVTGKPEGSDTEVTLEVLHGEMKLNSGNSWKGEWKDLPVNDTITKDGVSVTGKIYYRVEEVPVDGYETSYDRAEGKVPNNGTVVITNKQLTQITVEKKWVNQDANIAPEIEFNLIQKAVPISSETAAIDPVILEKGIKLNSENEWKTTFDKLPLVSDDGLYTYVYVAEETVPDGYSVTYTPENGATADTLTITNTRPLVSVTAEKVYDAPSYEPDKLPAVQVALVRSITQNGVTLEEVVDTQTLTAGTPYTWSNLHQAGTITAKDGTSVSGDYTYSVRETVPLGFSVSYSTENGVVNFVKADDGTVSGAVTITNTEQTQLKVVKDWDESVPESERQEIQFKLWRTRTENEEVIYCEACEQRVPTADAHVAKCTGENHYTCDGKDHGLCTLCGEGYLCEVQSDGKTPAHGEGVCTDDPIFCFNCDQEVDSPTAHVAPCGQSGHYTCYEDASLHAPADCGTAGHYKCDGLNHGIADCKKEGHNACDGGNHGWCALCGAGYVCDVDADNKSLHGMGVCYIPGQMVKCPNCQQDVPNERSHVGLCGQNGHWSCWGSQHYSAPCGTDGHFVCDGKNHQSTDCGIEGHYNCDGKTHQTAWQCGKTGHYQCDGRTHGTCTYCQGYTCDGNEHGLNVCAVSCPAGCGKTVTSEDAHLCGSGLHYTCVTDGYHVKADCGLEGHYYCDGRTHQRTYTCNIDGHMQCDGMDHSYCQYCGKYICDSDVEKHGDGLCGTKCPKCQVAVSSADAHKGYCGVEDHWTCQWPYVHDEPAPCGIAGHYTCSGTHTDASCGIDGHYECDGKNHNAWPDDCKREDHHACDGLNHTKCQYCNQFICSDTTAEHGIGSCVVACVKCEELVLTPDAHLAACGNHYTCVDGDKHSVAQHCPFSDHYECDGQTHAPVGWGYATCNGSGHYTCDGLNHTQCQYCGVYQCYDATVDHTDGACLVVKCPQCGSTEVTSEDEHLLNCSHYSCDKDYDADDHATCELCSQYLCNGQEHGAGECDNFVTVQFLLYNSEGTERLNKTVYPEIGGTVTWSIWYPWYSYAPTITSVQVVMNGVTTNQSTPTVQDDGGKGLFTFSLSNVTADATFTVIHSDRYTNTGDVWTYDVQVSSPSSLILTNTTFTRTATAGSGSSASFGTLTSAPRASDTVDTTGATDMGTFVLNEENNWEHIFYELPQYSSDGKYKYTYFVQEVTTGYDVTYDNNAGIVEGVITITNAKKVPTTKSLSVTKLWKDESWTTEHMDKNAYVLTTTQTRYFKLLDNEKDVTDSIPGIVGATISDGYIVLTTAAGTSSASFKINEIPIGGKYEFKEYELITGADGTKTYVEARDYSVEHTAGSNDYTIVNQLTDITIYKVWADASDKLVYTRPAVEFELWRTLANGTDELVEKKTMVSPSTALTWDMLPLTDGNGHTYSYYVKEVLPNGFTSADGNVEVAQGGGGTITNTPTELTVRKVWKDYFGQAITKTEGTIYYKLMQQKVSFSEGKETTVGEAVAYLPTVFELTHDADPSNSDNDWKNVHSVLPRYWENSADGTAGEYRYFVIETDKDGNQIYAQYDKISVDVATPQTITITNTLTEIHVKKIWSVAGGDLPDPLPDITLQLRYNYVGGGVQATEDPIAFETVLSVKNNNFTVSRDEKGNVFWAYAWTNLPTHDIINGEAKQRYYYVVEPKDKIPEGFRQVVGTGEAVQMNNIGITGNTSSEGVIEITNELISYTLPETGGAGTTPYTVCGLLLMTAAMALMYRELTRKKLRGEGRES